MKSTLSARLQALGIVILRWPAGAVQEAYISDRLVVGLYEREDLAGESIRALVSGTSVEVLAHKPGAVRVRTADAAEGWVEVNAVSEEKPARTQLLEAQAELQRLKARGADVGGARNLPAAETDLQAELDQAHERIAQLNKERAGLLTAQRMTQKQLEALQQRVAEATALLGAEKPADGEVGQPEKGYRRYMPLIAAAVVALIGFIAGATLMDHRMRKRHGGFRL